MNNFLWLQGASCSGDTISFLNSEKSGHLHCIQAAKGTLFAVMEDGQKNWILSGVINDKGTIGI